MIGFESQESIASSIDSWTQQQCNEYLGKYPKGLKSEQVKKRLEVLNSHFCGPRELSAPANTHSTSKSSAITQSASPQQKQPTTYSGNTSTTNRQSGNQTGSADSSKFKTYFLKFLTFVIIGAVAVGIGATVPILGIPTALAAYAIYRAIWHS